MEPWQEIWNRSVSFGWARVDENGIVSCGPVRILVGRATDPVVTTCVTLRHPREPWRAQSACAYALEVSASDLDGEELLRTGLADAKVVGRTECSWTGKEVSARLRRDLDSSELDEAEITRTLVTRMVGRQKGKGGGAGGRGGRDHGSGTGIDNLPPRRTGRTSRMVKAGEPMPGQVGSTPLPPALQGSLDLFRALTPNAGCLPFWADHPTWRRFALAGAALEHPVDLLLVTGRDAAYSGAAPVVERNEICYVPVTAGCSRSQASSPAAPMVDEIRQLIVGAPQSLRPLSEIIDQAFASLGKWEVIAASDPDQLRSAANVESVLRRYRAEGDSPAARRGLRQALAFLGSGSR